MRENRTFGSTRGREGGRNSHLFLSTLLVKKIFPRHPPRTGLGGGVPFASFVVKKYSTPELNHEF